MLFFEKTKFGAWPSGKATGFGPVIQRFESFRPSFFLSFDFLKSQKIKSLFISYLQEK